MWQIIAWKEVTSLKSSYTQDTRSANDRMTTVTKPEGMMSNPSMEILPYFCAWSRLPFLPVSDVIRVRLRHHKKVWLTLRHVFSLQMSRLSWLWTWSALLPLLCIAPVNSAAVMSVDLGSEWMKIAVVTVREKWMTWHYLTENITSCSLSFFSISMISWNVFHRFLP